MFRLARRLRRSANMLTRFGWKRVFSPGSAPPTDDNARKKGISMMSWSRLGRRRGQNDSQQGGYPPGSPLIRTLILAVGCSLVAGVLAYLMFNDASQDTSRLARAPMMITTPGGEIQRDSDRYQTTVKEANQNNVELVTNTDESYILIPEVVPTSIEAEELPTALPWANSPLAGQDVLPDGLEAVPIQGHETETNAKIPASDASILTQKLLNELNGTSSSELTPRSGHRDESHLPAQSEPSYTPPESGFQASTNVPLATVRTSHSIGKSEENPYKQPMLNQMNAITRAMVIKPPATLTLIGGSAEQVNGYPNPESLEMFERQETDGSDGRVLVQAGRVLYGHIVAGVSSDQATPVLAEITLGNLKGWRLIGGFQSNVGNSGLLIEFTTLVEPDGQEHRIAALAIDGKDGEAIIASDVNHRIIQRYGPVFAVSFIAGLSNGMSTPRKTISTLGASQIEVAERPTLEQGLYAGLESGVNAIVSDIAANSPDGPLITIDPGHPIGIIFTRSFVREGVS